MFKSHLHSKTLNADTRRRSGIDGGNDSEELSIAGCRCCAGSYPKIYPEFTRLHSILVCAFALQTIRGYDFAIPTYICATGFAALDPSVLHAASTCPSYRFCLRLVLHLLHDTPFFDRPLPHLAIPSPSEVPRAFLGQSHQAVGRVFHVDGKESRDFTEVA